MPFPTSTINTSSTFYDPNYSRSKVIQNKFYKKGKDQYYVPEFFSMDYIRLMRAMGATTTTNYGFAPITTRAFKLYGNTTCWWMLQLLNGITHPLATPASMIIGLPDVTVLPSLTSVSNTVNINQTNVTI